MKDTPSEGALMLADLFKQRDELTRAQQSLGQQVERLNDRIGELAKHCEGLEKERNEACAQLATAQARAEASFDALAKGARDVPCSGPCYATVRCGACRAHANQAGLAVLLDATRQSLQTATLERDHAQRVEVPDALLRMQDAEFRLSSLRAKVEGMRGHGSLLDWVSRAELLALLKRESP